MKRKVSEATGPTLDWMVELAKGTHWSANGYFIFGNPRRIDPNPEWQYSSNWAQGGPIIENHIFMLEDGDGIEEWTERWAAESGGYRMFGPTALIAAMRAYVASKLGDEVEVPEELQ